MEYQAFLKEIERLDAEPVEEQKLFYAQTLKKEQQHTKIRLLAYFHYAVLFYYEGNFRKVQEILEPFIFNYQSYPYIPEMISCFNLIGMTCHCEGEYELARCYYTRGLKIAQKYQERSRFSYEYNNLALTYIAQKNYSSALENILLAEQHLKESDNDMGAYIYLNLAVIYHNLGELDEAAWSFDRGIRLYHCLDILPDDSTICGLSIAYKRGDTEQYEAYKTTLFERLEQMYASEFMDACQAIFDCALESKDDALATRIIQAMDTYLVNHPQEFNIGLRVENCKYQYAKLRGCTEAMLAALEQKDRYYAQIVTSSELQNIKQIEQYFRINRKLQQSIENETRANRVKSRFLANMSHDLRTPINGIMGMLTVLRKCQDDPEKINDCLEKIESSSHLLLSLVNNILNVTKSESDAVEDLPDEKSDFLPPQKPPEPSGSEALFPDDLYGKTLLIVEDNELNMEIAEFILTDAGAIVHKAENGQLALEQYLAAPDGTYNAILMDLMMPVMDGYQAAKAIRASAKPDAQTVPIIAVSANAYDEDIRKCLDSGMNTHLSKPLYPDVLISTILKFTK